MDDPITRVQLRVSTGAERTGVVGRHGAAWKVRVAAAPERGKANHAVLELLAGVLRVPRAKLELMTGHGARDKVIAVEGLSGAEAERRLAGAVAAGR